MNLLQIFIVDSVIQLASILGRSQHYMFTILYLRMIFIHMKLDVKKSTQNSRNSTQPMSDKARADCLYSHPEGSKGNRDSKHAFVPKPLAKLRVDDASLCHI